MKINIALLGCGTIGSGFLELLEKQTNALSDGLDVAYELSSILVRNLSKYKTHPLYHLMTDDFNKVLAQKPNLVVELMGGVSPTKDYLLAAMDQGCHIITANKDLLAEHGFELFEKAALNHLSIGFEASVGGGIPIIKPLKDSLRNGGIYRIEGIVNGTCNYILTRMSESVMGYDEALTEAMARGFAESNPHSDVSGLDSARKLCLLSSLSFNKFVNPSMVYTKGIDVIDARHVQLARANGLKIKLVALALSYDGQIYNAVRPCLVSASHPFYSIDHEYNGIRLYGHAFGKMQLTGKGAGMHPTANAVFGDFLDYCHGKADKGINYPGDQHFEALKINPEACDWILQVLDNPDADELGRILQTFSDHKLSIHKTPKVNGVSLFVEDLLEVELHERLSLLREWCAGVEIAPMMFLK